jgi:hypothetical protein
VLAHVIQEHGRFPQGSHYLSQKLVAGIDDGVEQRSRGERVAGVQRYRATGF